MTSPYPLVSFAATAVWLVVSAAAAQHPGGSGRPDAAALASALERVRAQSPRAYHLRVDCAGEPGVRSVEVFPSGVAIWDLRTQVTLPDATRRELLDALVVADYPSLAPQYGGRRAPSEPKAALRVVCRIEIELEGVRGSSIQLAEGEQSARLRELANELLDRVAPHAAQGVRAEGVADGLRKLAQGVLRPEGFELRFLELSGQGADATGSILRVRGRELSVQPYAPGREIGEPVGRELDPAEWSDLLEALVGADFSVLPVNLWSERQLELEVRMLDHGHTVYARPFARLSRERPVAAQGRFDRLADAVRALSAELR